MLKIKEAERVLAEKNALVTGATGAIGTVLANRLAQTRYQEGGFVRGMTRKSDPNLAEDFRERGLEIFVGDISKPDDIKRAVEGVNVIFHLAGEMAIRSNEAIQRTNIEGTKNLASAAVETGIERVIFISSIAVYGAREGTIYEHSPLAARGPYGQSKIEGEKILFDNLADRVNVLRPGEVLAPRSIWYNLFLLAKKGIPIPLDKNAIFHPTYVQNLVDAAVLAAANEVSRETFNIVDVEVTLEKLLTTYAKIWGIEKIFFLPGGNIGWRVVAGMADLQQRITGKPPVIDTDALTFFQGRREYSTEKAKNLLGWEPQIPLSGALRRIP